MKICFSIWQRYPRRTQSVNQSITALILEAVFAWKDTDENKKTRDCAPCLRNGPLEAWTSPWEAVGQWPECLLAWSPWEEMGPSFLSSSRHGKTLPNFYDKERHFHLNGQIFPTVKKVLQFIYPLTYWRTSFGNYELSSYKHLGGVVVKNLPANRGDAKGKGSSPGLQRSPGVGNGNPLQHSCWQIPCTEDPGSLPSMSLQSGTHDWATVKKEHFCYRLETLTAEQALLLTRALISSQPPHKLISYAPLVLRSLDRGDHFLGN